MKKYPEYKKLDLSQISKDILKFWQDDKTFEKSLSTRDATNTWVFYEGPPSANGMPGIHHVMARAIKDIFCRFKTLQGYHVNRKAGWDTHGLPIELGVEKSLGITKEDIGNPQSSKYISVEDYNKACRKEVMKYTDKWEDLTAKMGYWVDMSNPYITYDNKYIESVWWLIQNLSKKDLLYKGYTIQPYSPAAGTGLSSHEINQPGCYKNVKDRTATVQFKIKDYNKLKIKQLSGDLFILAWTTTPWTLPSNTALAVGKDIDYVFVNTFNQFNGQAQTVVLAKELINKYFSEKNADLKLENFKIGDKNIPFNIIFELKGSDLEGLQYDQLLPFEVNKNVELNGETINFYEAGGKIIIGDFVTTTDGTGIVHLAPSFGADDFRVAKQNNIGALTLVNKQGKFLSEVKDGIFLYGNEYVKEAYLSEEEKKSEFENQKFFLEDAGKIKELKAYLSVDERIVLKLQEEGKLFKKETYEHSYPHCWRTDKPILYYPLDSWFIKSTALKDRMIELNKTINWKPSATGTGRFGNWLENLNDWNLSRSRFWGIPIPIWTSADGFEQLVIGSTEELKQEIEHSITHGFMVDNPLSKFVPGNFKSENYNSFDLHKPYVDTIILAKNGKKLFREPDLIDVWFDSGAMPYAQVHYPFENKELIDDKKYFPADFIAEGVDQTRGWFFTLHAIAAMNFNSVAYKNVVSNGLVLDKNGNKMSKRLGNSVDPFETIEKYGADATRWYMIANAAPWDNLKFSWTNIYEDKNGNIVEQGSSEYENLKDKSIFKLINGRSDGIAEVQRKLFGTLYNIYGFFALYANVDKFIAADNTKNSIDDRIELDKWIDSKLQSLIQDVTLYYNEFEPHRAARAIEEFVDEHLSNWYVRLSRRRFWRAEMSADKIVAYETLFNCLTTIAQLMSPIAPFFSDWLYQSLTLKTESVHLTNLVQFQKKFQDKNLEERMELAQKISSMILSIRKKENIKVRQPLQRIQIPILDRAYQQKIEAVSDLILDEVNVKKIDFVDESQTQIVKQLKLNFKTLGKKCGQNMKLLQSYAAENGNKIISEIERNAKFTVNLNNFNIELIADDVEIIPIDIPGWKVANNGSITVALDINISEELRNEGLARELVNRIQNLRKDSDFEVTDKILVKIQQKIELDNAIKNNLSYICSETLITDFQIVNNLSPENSTIIEVDENLQTLIYIEKIN